MQAVRQNWLFLGEACYRFSLAVARSGLSGSSKCVATSFGDLDGEEKSKAKEELLRFGFECKDNVDATCLEDVAWGEAKPPFDRFGKKCVSKCVLFMQKDQQGFFHVSTWSEKGTRGFVLPTCRQIVSECE